MNPRVDETNVYDAADNRRRTTITYTDYSLPDVVTEYEANASTVYRKTDTDYVTSSTYINNRVIGLPAKIEIKDANNNVKAKTEFTYDSSGEYFTNVTGKDNHDDTNYGSGFVAGRGNLCIVKRYEIGGSGYIETGTGYNSLGQVVFTRDGADHQTNITYADSFSDGVNTRNTHAYPTAVKDADENHYLNQYNYDFGAITRTEDPLGAVVTHTYDSVGRPDATTNLASSTDTTKQARTRFEYGPNYVLKYVRGFNGSNETYTNTQFDGAGRVRAVASDFPGSTGGYKAAYTYFDIMGRAIEQTNPTEVNSSWVPAGDDSAGFASMIQTLDWKGRSLVTTNQDDNYKTASYTGCGCAGGEVVTLTDELGRKQKLYSDVFGRPTKDEVYSSSTNVNSTTTTTYNVLDQPTQVREYAGTDSSSTYQDTTMQYDGYGRLWKTHRPEFAANTYTTITYNADDTRATVTDPRSSVATFTYNDRHLVTGISYSAPTGIPTVPTSSFTYDAAGNRLTMDWGTSSVDYTYDTASRLTSETQSLTGVTGEFTLNYTYHPAGPLASVEDPFDRTVSYTYDKAGQLTSIAATGYPNVSSFITSVQYRAWGTAKNIDYGNGVTQSAGFNERMQPTSHLLEDLRLFDNSTYSISSTYDYYGDGRLFHAFYNSSGGSFPKFDRKYQYDFAGRISETYTGREAHDQSPLTPRDNPYRQTFQYDAFGHLSQRSGMLWRQAIPTETATYTNNQRSDWSYDAAGNLVYAEDSAFAPDAAGQNSYSTLSQTDSLGGGDYRFLDANITHGMDGDGLIRHRIEYRYVEESIGEELDFTEETTENFYLWSTAMGAMVAELDAEGDLKTAFVYAARRLARLEVTPSSTSVNFEFADTQTGTTFQATHTGVGGVERELDSIGAQVPKIDPFISSNRLYSDLKPKGQLFIGGSDPYRFDGTCQLDGMPTSCDLVHRLMENGSLALKIGTGPTAVVVPIDTWGISSQRVYRARWWKPDSGRKKPEEKGTAWGDAGIWNEVVVIFETEMFGSRLNPFSQLKSKAQKKRKIEPAVIKKAIADCISEMWPDLALVDFTATQKPTGRENTDTFNGVTEVKDVHDGRTAKIVSDPTPPPEAQAAMDKRRLGGATPIANPWNPYWGYVRWGREGYGSAASEYVYSELYGANPYLQTQIHELGVSLSRIVQKFYPQNWRQLGRNYLDPADTDNGPQFEDCVGKKVYQQMGLKPREMNVKRQGN